VDPGPLTVWCRGRSREPVLHLVYDTAPVVVLGDGQAVRFALCGLSVEPWPPEPGRGGPYCPECRRRSNGVSPPSSARPDPTTA
jgi:hypothetical protein